MCLSNDDCVKCNKIASTSVKQTTNEKINKLLELMGEMGNEMYEMSLNTKEKI